MFFEHPDNIHNYPLQLIFMEWWITKKQLFLRQDARSWRMKNQPNGALGHPMANKATLWAQQCITIDVLLAK
jgi:hypothetical protein